MLLVSRQVCAGVDQQHSRRLVTGRRKDNSDRVGLFKLIDFGALFADQEFVQRKVDIDRGNVRGRQFLNDCNQFLLGLGDLSLVFTDNFNDDVTNRFDDGLERRVDFDA